MTLPTLTPREPKLTLALKIFKHLSLGVFIYESENAVLTS